MRLCYNAPLTALISNCICVAKHGSPSFNSPISHSGEHKTGHLKDQHQKFSYKPLCTQSPNSFTRKRILRKNEMSFIKEKKQRIKVAGRERQAETVAWVASTDSVGVVYCCFGNN